VSAGAGLAAAGRDGLPAAMRRPGCHEACGTEERYMRPITSRITTIRSSSPAPPLG
jgi:hypothetical protein